MPRALLSVSDKTGLVPFARALQDLGFELVSTGGTARALIEAGVPVTGVSDVTGFPEMMDGRVKTLHPAIHAGILARRTHPEDMDAICRLGIGLIDVVAVNLYPFARAAADPDTSFDALIEQIDIGGPSLVRAAAKACRDVLVLVSPDDYEEVLDRLRAPGGVPAAYRLALATKAFAHTAAYDAAIAEQLGRVRAGDHGFERVAAPRGCDARLVLDLHKVRDLRYGENPHQMAAWYRRPGAAGLEVIQGKELSFTNLIDLESAARIVSEFDEPAAVVIKHTNPCGAATGPSLDDAYLGARDADSVSAYGGIVGLNRIVDEPTARTIVSTFIEALVAPGVTDEARAVLAARKNMRVLIADPGALAPPDGRYLDVRSIFDGVLVEDRDAVVEAGAAWPVDGLRVVTRRQPTAAEWRGLRFAWRVCAHVKSNAVIFTAEDRTLAIGAGQMSRVDAVRVAIMKAADRQGRGEGSGPVLRGSVVASDAFFPFRDGLDAAVAAGATAIVQPGGSTRDAEVVAAADEHGIAMVFTGRRHFRH